MITKVQQWFNKWLELMEPAYRELTKEEFAELEKKIIEEIRSRK